jgi:hypothetical protein
MWYAHDDTVVKLRESPTGPFTADLIGLDAVLFVMGS